MLVSPAQWRCKEIIQDGQTTKSRNPQHHTGKEVPLDQKATPSKKAFLLTTCDLVLLVLEIARYGLPCWSEGGKIVNQRLAIKPRMHLKR